MPMVYAIPLALLCQLLPFDLHGLFFFAPLNIFANAFVGVAMIALGVQINRTPLNFFKADVMLASALRLIISPLLAAVMTILFIIFYGPMHPIAAQTIVIEKQSRIRYANRNGYHHIIGSDHATLYHIRLLYISIILKIYTSKGSPERLPFLYLIHIMQCDKPGTVLY